MAWTFHVIKKDDSGILDVHGGVSLTDFYAYMPLHKYIFVPTRDLWPAVSVNARIKPVPKLRQVSYFAG
jgi:hypothetical protein